MKWVLNVIKVIAVICLALCAISCTSKYPIENIYDAERAYINDYQNTHGDLDSVQPVDKSRIADIYVIKARKENYVNDEWVTPLPEYCYLSLLAYGKDREHRLLIDNSMDVKVDNINGSDRLIAVKYISTMLHRVNHKGVVIVDVVDGEVIVKITSAQMSVNSPYYQLDTIVGRRNGVVGIDFQFDHKDIENIDASEATFSIQHIGASVYSIDVIGYGRYSIWYEKK